MTLICHNSAPFENKPRAVLIDIDNTLYHFDPAHETAMEAVEAKANNVLGLDENDFSKAFAKARTALKARLSGTAACHSRLLYMQQTLELLGLKTQMFMALDFEQTYWRTFLSHAVLFSGVKDFLHALRRVGISTCAVTDLGAQIQFRKLIYFGLNDCFDFVVTSEEAGAEKPAVAPFELAIGKLGVAPNETFMIGDEAATDILGARAANIAAAQKRHTGIQVFTDKRKPDIVFDTFPELERHFAAYGWIETTPKKTAAKKS
jgi:HAD superfamily hydrolase (TIGR01549 family)